LQSSHEIRSANDLSGQRWSSNLAFCLSAIGVAACVSTGACWLVGQGSVMSFNRWSEWHPLNTIPRLAGLNVFGLFDFLTANLLMPMSALLVSVFVGWRLKNLIPEGELSGLSGTSLRLLLFALRYLCPVGIVIVVIVGFTG
jgi:NSS family neurotransmitter:Na+ symporter